jgi:dihydrofolate reductase
MNFIHGQSGSSLYPNPTQERAVRKLITGFKISVDGRIAGPEGYADWVEGWSEDYGLSSQIDACLIGGGMYPGYEKYWTAIHTAGDAPLPMTGKIATPGEAEWGRFAARTAHYVLSTTLRQTQWSNTRFLRSLEEVCALKAQPGKDIYLMGGGRAAVGLIEAGLVDELRLIVHPLIVVPGMALFAAATHGRRLELRRMAPLSQGRIGLNYAIGSPVPERVRY